MVAIFTLMHIVHVLGVILWIGGLAFITILVIPATIKNPNALEKVLQFQRIEHKFAPIARVYNLIVLISGFYMFFSLGLEEVIFTSSGMPLLFMTVVGIFWFIMLFGLEPLIIKKVLDRMAKKPEEMNIDSIFAVMNKLHWVLLTISLLASGAGVIVAHGYF